MDKLSCKERELILGRDEGCPGWTVEASLTDLHGEFGMPRVETIWTDGKRRIKDIRHPNADYLQPDIQPCEHYELALSEAGEL